MTDRKKLKVSCDTKDSLPIGAFEEFQGELKDLSKDGFEKLKAAMIRHGICAPVFVWRDGKRNRIIDGHQRLRVLGKMVGDGWECPEIPVVYITAKDEPQARRILLAMVSQYGRPTGDGLFKFMMASDIKLDELKADFDIPNINFDLFSQEFFTETKGEIPEDPVPEKPKTPVSKLGNIWELGRHRLICGDSTQAETIKNLIGGGVPPFLMVTDPPYGVEYAPEWREKSLKAWKKPRSTGKVVNDDRIDWRPVFQFFQGHVIYCWHAGKFASQVSESLQASGFDIRSQIIWKKQHFVISRGDYHWHHEPCWYAVRKGQKSKWSGDRKQSTIWEIKNASAMGGENQKEQTGHGTQKPVECMARPIRNHGEKTDSVFDPFLGSGTTLIAAEHLNRQCFGVELDPGYCDVIIERWQTLTGEKAKRIDG